MCSCDGQGQKWDNKLMIAHMKHPVGKIEFTRGYFRCVNKLHIIVIHVTLNKSDASRIDHMTVVLWITRLVSAQGQCSNCRERD